jgi:hypothetical protein
MTYKVKEQEYKNQGQFDIWIQLLYYSIIFMM